jgi:hypothetical protein
MTVLSKKLIMAAFAAKLMALPLPTRQRQKPKYLRRLQSRFSLPKKSQSLKI